MSTEPIIRHTPYLRRYARALTGSQAEGDALVQAALENLLSGHVHLDRSAALRTALFRALHDTWRLALNGHSIDAPRRLPADQRLQRMTPEHRTALLLVLMEGFSLAETAYILGVDELSARHRFEAAQRSIEGQLATDVLIIEDEPVIALDLQRLADDLGHRIIGVAATHQEAVGLVANRTPGLVLADVRLADGSSGVEAVGEILRSYDVPVIFITAYPERLLTGSRPEPAFLVTKPFSEETVKAMIGQALFFHQPRPRLKAVV
ncbi:MAG: response regulator [Caulobacteraceae bacterium]|nr:response regulator [Caulobacteraceae bacterium]